MRELSIFVDEAGDFGEYELHSPFYIVTLVFHDQSKDITQNLNRMYESIRQRGLPDSIHAGPLIRREYEYKDLLIGERKQIWDTMFHFLRLADITYRSIVVEKKQLVKEMDLHLQITKQLSAFLKENMGQFLQYDRIVVYYDYGQMELAKILVSVFNSVLSDVEFKKVVPADYKLFQAADMLCTIELLTLKTERKTLSNSELAFFKSPRDLYKMYLKAIHKKRF